MRGSKHLLLLHVNKKALHLSSLAHRQPADGLSDWLSITSVNAVLELVCATQLPIFNKDVFVLK